MSKQSWEVSDICLFLSVLVYLFNILKIFRRIYKSWRQKCQIISHSWIFYKKCQNLNDFLTSAVPTYTLFGKEIKRKVVRYHPNENLLSSVLDYLAGHTFGEILPLAFGPTQKYHLTPRHAPNSSFGKPFSSLCKYLM